MKRKSFVMGIAALVMAALLAVPTAAAEDEIPGGEVTENQELTNEENEKDTEVDARIVDPAGEVAYIVSVPKKIDFGNLVSPEKDEDSFLIQKYDVTCEQMSSGLSQIKVFVFNYLSVEGEGNQIFYLSNQTNNSCSFKPEYEVYVGRTKIDTTEPMGAMGYEYVFFTKEGESVKGGVRLNQRQLYPYKDNISAIAGEYTGYMVFTTSAS